MRICVARYWDRIQEVAMERHLRNRKNSNYILANPLPELVGIAGECAFAVMMGMKVDKAVRMYGDGGVDFKHRSLGSIDVKSSTAYPAHRWLLQKKSCGLPANLYVLVGVDVASQSCDILGACSRSYLADSDTINFGYCDNYGRHESDMEFDWRYLSQFSEQGCTHAKSR